MDIILLNKGKRLLGGYVHVKQKDLCEVWWNNTIYKYTATSL